MIEGWRQVCGEVCNAVHTYITAGCLCCGISYTRVDRGKPLLLLLLPTSPGGTSPPPLAAGTDYACASTVTITNTGNVRLSGITLSGTVDTSTCSPTLTDAVLAPAGVITCGAKHTTTLAEFEASKLQLQVNGSATALGFATGAADVTNSTASVDISLVQRKTATLQIAQSPSASPVTTVGEWLLSARWQRGCAHRASLVP